MNRLKTAFISSSTHGMREYLQALLHMTEPERRKLAIKERNALYKKAASASRQWLTTHRDEPGLHVVATALLRWAEMPYAQQTKEPSKVERHFRTVFKHARVLGFEAEREVFMDALRRGDDPITSLGLQGIEVPVPDPAPVEGTKALRKFERLRALEKVNEYLMIADKIGAREEPIVQHVKKLVDENRQDGGSLLHPRAARKQEAASYQLIYQAWESSRKRFQECEGKILAAHTA